MRNTIYYHQSASLDLFVRTKALIFNNPFFKKGKDLNITYFENNILKSMVVENITVKCIVIGRCGAEVSINDLTNESVYLIYEYYFTLFEGLKLIQESQLGIKTINNFITTLNDLRFAVLNYVSTYNIGTFELSYHKENNIVTNKFVSFDITKNKFILENKDEVDLTDLTNVCLYNLYNHYHNYLKSYDALKLAKFGICVSNDSHNDLQIQKIDDVTDVLNKYGILPHQLKDDDTAIKIFNNIDYFKKDEILTLRQYNELMKVDTLRIKSIEEVQDYLRDECDLSVFDYPIDETKYASTEVNENLVLVCDENDEIRVCEF